MTIKAYNIEGLCDYIFQHSYNKKKIIKKLRSLRYSEEYEKIIDLAISLGAKIE